MPNPAMSAWFFAWQLCNQFKNVEASVQSHFGVELIGALQRNSCTQAQPPKSFGMYILYCLCFFKGKCERKVPFCGMLIDRGIHFVVRTDGVIVAIPRFTFATINIKTRFRARSIACNDNAVGANYFMHGVIDNRRL